MRFRMASVTGLVAATLTGTLLTAGAHTAHAQAALDDDDNSKPVATTSNESGGTGDDTRIGVGLRVRNVWVPKSIIELFVDHAPGGSSEPGFGLDVSRRKGDFEVELGFEYENIHVDPGIWVERGKAPTRDGGGADHVTFNNFGWFTAEVTFLNHTSFGRYVALRYGGGAGIGILKGSVNRTDSVCDNADAKTVDTPANPCHDEPNPNSNTPYNLPPVFPVINAIVGVQFRPTDDIVINVEGGIRTLPFFGISGGYYF